jgi:hypothetical protein
MRFKSSKAQLRFAYCALVLQITFCFCGTTFLTGSIYQSKNHTPPPTPPKNFSFPLSCKKLKFTPDHLLPFLLSFCPFQLQFALYFFIFSPFLSLFPLLSLPSFRIYLPYDIG